MSQESSVTPKLQASARPSIPQAVLSRLLFAIVFGLIAASSPVQGLEALVTWTDPEVTVSGEITGVGQPTGQPLRQWDRLPEGTRIHLPTERKASLLCSSDHWIDLQDTSTWNVTPHSCARGRRLELGTYRRLTPRAGRYVTENNTMVRKRSVRSGTAQAIMLSPRHSSVTEARPTFVWRGLHTADAHDAEYELHLSGMPRPLRMPLRDLECHPDDNWGTQVVCRAPWPAAYPALEEGQKVFWQIGFRSTITAPLIQAKNKVPIERLSAEASTRLAEGLKEINSLPLDAAQQSLLNAGLFAQHRLYPEAIDAYRDLIRQVSPREALDRNTVTVTIGDLYLSMGLLHLAEAAYHEALMSPDRVVQAAAAAGLGDSLTKRRAFAEAAEHYRRAQARYTAAGWTHEAAAAEAAAVDAERRSGSGS